MDNYNIDEMTLAEMIALYVSIPIDDRPNHYLLRLHIEMLQYKTPIGHSL